MSKQHGGGSGERPCRQRTCCLLGGRLRSRRGGRRVCPFCFGSRLVVHVVLGHVERLVELLQPGDAVELGLENGHRRLHSPKPRAHVAQLAFA